MDKRTFFKRLFQGAAVTAVAPSVIKEAATAVGNAEVEFSGSYLSGYMTFSKNMTDSLPFLQQTLPQLLAKDYYRKEMAMWHDISKDFFPQKA